MRDVLAPEEVIEMLDSVIYTLQRDEDRFFVSLDILDQLKQQLIVDLEHIDVVR